LTGSIRTQIPKQKHTILGNVGKKALLEFFDKEMHSKNSKKKKETTQSIPTQIKQ